MAVLDIVLYPDDRLRARCEPVDEITDEIRALISDMVDTMYDAPGVGLAAPQVGRALRITVIDCASPENEEPNLWVLINPRLLSKSGSIIWEEGCLSIPGVFEDVKRAEKVLVRAMNLDGETYDIEADGLEAVCLQHELDHLDGVLFLDKLSRLKLRMALKSYKRTLPQYLKDREEKRKKKNPDESPDESDTES